MRQSNTLPLASPSESISPEYYQGSQNLANATIPLFDIIPGMAETQTWKTPGEIADEWGISDRRVRILCAEGRISPTRFDGKHWLISPNAVRPRDGRITRYSGNSSTDESIAVDIIRKRQTVVRNLRRTSAAERKRQWERQFHSFLLSAIPKLGIRDFAVADLERILRDRGVQGVALSVQMAAVFFERAMRFILSETRKRRRLEPKIVREINCLLARGYPDGTGLFRSEAKVATLANTLDEFRRSTGVIHKRLARLFAAIVGSSPFTAHTSSTAFVLINYLLLSEGLPPIVLDLVKSCESARTYLADLNRSRLAEEIRYQIYRSLNEYDALTPLG